MAINVDTVYKTVLLILNKEQRGYMTPDEFNKTATQVQLDIFEQYFDDLNQQSRVPQLDVDYADRQIVLDEKISPFKTEGSCIYSSSGFFNLPTNPINGNATILYNGEIPIGSAQVSFYRLGTPIFTSATTNVISEIQMVSRREFYNLQKSEYTAPSENSPIFLYEDNKLTVSPVSIQSGVSTSFIRKPRNVNWNFDVDANLNVYVYKSLDSVNFELNSSEQVNVILRILAYAGIVIRDPEIVQAAASQVQQ